jgi:hypothetical protein
MSNYTSVLTMLLRLRQGNIPLALLRLCFLACDHPALVTAALTIDKDAIDSISADNEPDQGDELADLLGGLDVAEGAKCQICFTK